MKLVFVVSVVALVFAGLLAAGTVFYHLLACWSNAVENDEDEHWDR